MDTQIWYAIFSTVIGGIYGAFSHLGEVRDSCAFLWDGLLNNKLSKTFLFCFLPFLIVDKNSWHAKGKIRICSIGIQQASCSIFQRRNQSTSEGVLLFLLSFNAPKYMLSNMRARYYSIKFCSLLTYVVSLLTL